MISKVDLVKQLGLSLDIVNSIYSSVNQENIRTQAASLFSYIVWDEVSNINGIEAEAILNSSRNDIPTTEGRRIYIKMKQGKALIIQPHNPLASGILAMTDADVDNIAQYHMNEFIDMEANNMILNEYKKVIDTM